MKVMNLKRLLSYIIPINIYQTNSEINKNLEVTWNNGQLVLDSKNTNFSYGSLQRVMRIGLNAIGKNKIQNYNTALVLGVGGGSVINTLQNEFDFKGKIIGVELDEKAIEIANQYFGLNKFKNTEIVIDDAYHFVKKTNQKFDLIIIDIFQDKIMPDFLFEDDFINTITKIVSENGSGLFNTIATLSTDFERNLAYQKIVKTKFKKVVKLSKIEGDNELFILSNDCI